MHYDKCYQSEDQHSAEQNTEHLKESSIYSFLSFGGFSFGFASFFPAFLHLVAHKVKHLLDGSAGVNIYVIRMFDSGIADIVIVYRFFDDKRRYALPGSKIKSIISNSV